MVTNRIVKNVATGASVGADELGRYITPHQRAFIVHRLTNEVEERSARLLDEARTAAAALLGDAEAAAAAIRAEARAQGYAEGREAGYAEGHGAARVEAEHLTSLLQRAAADADQVRRALLADVEHQAVDLALAAAEKIVGAVAREHHDLAAVTVAAGIRGAGGRVLRVHVHPNDAEPVRVVVSQLARDAGLEIDESVGRGGCRIDVEGGTIDLALDAQLEGVRQLFRDG